MKFRQSGNPNFPDVQQSGFPDIRQSGNADFWKSGLPEIRISEIPDFLKSGFRELWKSGLPEIRVAFFSSVGGSRLSRHVEAAQTFQDAVAACSEDVRAW